MEIPRGKNIRLSTGRRILCDLMHFSRMVPLVSIERVMDLRPVIEARKALPQRPSWYAIFLKAYGAVGARMPVFRRAYMKFPWPHLHEYACNIGVVPIERELDGEPSLLFLKMKAPEELPLPEIDRLIREAKTQDVWTIESFIPVLWSMRWPRFMRHWGGWYALNMRPYWRGVFFGTFGLTGVAGLGSTSVHFLSPLTSTIAFGVIGEDGRTIVRMMFDHRVVDGTLTATAMQELERELNGPIADEMRAQAVPAAAPAV